MRSKSVAHQCDPKRSRILRGGRYWRPGRAALLLLGIFAPLPSGCQRPALKPFPPHPDIRPDEANADREPLRLDASQIKPMYTELLAVDLPTVARVAGAQNFDIRLARSSVEASLGEYESAVGRAFPAIVPTAIFEHVEGTVRATEGALVGVGFDTFQPSVAIQWIINPGRVIYEIVAAKKRLHATEHQEQAVVQETLRRAVVQYYSLAFAQARVSAAHQGVKEADELLRISRIRVNTGTGVPADELRAEARLAERRQDLVSSLHELYIASVALALTLHLDAAVTLIPNVTELPPTALVRSDLEIEELLGFAVAFRPDLESVRQLAEAVEAETGSTWWSGFGPEFTLGYQYGGITGKADNIKGGEGIPSNLVLNPASANGLFSGNPVANGLIREGILRGSTRLDGRDDQSFGFSDQQRANAGAGWRLRLSAFGDLKTAKAIERQALIRAQQMLDVVRAEVVTAAQASETQDQLVALARQQVTSAEEALRLSEANLRAGTMTTLDVLQAQDAATQARLRYAGAVVGYNQAQVNLLAALGLLSEDALLLDKDG
ncbi:MAG: TolC family protein [Phycisphaerae bacterium]